MRNNPTPLSESGLTISSILGLILLALIVILLVVACKKPEQDCWDCEITTAHQYADTTFIYDTIQTWCDIDKDWFEKFNTYYAEYPEYGFIVNQIVKCN